MDMKSIATLVESLFTLLEGKGLRIPEETEADIDRLSKQIPMIYAEWKKKIDKGWVGILASINAGSVHLVNPYTGDETDISIDLVFNPKKVSENVAGEWSEDRRAIVVYAPPKVDEPYFYAYVIGHEMLHALDPGFLHRKRRRIRNPSLSVYVDRKEELPAVVGTMARSFKEMLSFYNAQRPDLVDKVKEGLLQTLRTGKFPSKVGYDVLRSRHQAEIDAYKKQPELWKSKVVPVLYDVVTKFEGN